MEGLIPMVYKTIMKTKARRQYKSISSGGVADTHNAYNITKFYPDGYPHHQCKSLSSSGGAVSTCNSYDITKFYPDGYNYSYPTPAKGEKTESNYGHRRHKSCNIGGKFSPEDSDKSKQLVRFRSHRMFSCITGGA